MLTDLEQHCPSCISAAAYNVHERGLLKDLWKWRVKFKRHNFKVLTHMALANKKIRTFK